MRTLPIHHKWGEDLSQKGDMRWDTSDSSQLLAGEVQSVVAPGRWEVWAGSAVLFKKSCFQSRADCSPSESQGQPIFTLWRAMDRPQTLLEMQWRNIERLWRICKLSARCFLPATGKSKINPKGKS